MLCFVGQAECPVMMPFFPNTCSSTQALEVTQQTNCLRHFIPECEEQLQEIQQHKEKGLLYGIPISIKDHIGHKVLRSVLWSVPLWAGLGGEVVGDGEWGRDPNPACSHHRKPGWV